MYILAFYAICEFEYQKNFREEKYHKMNLKCLRVFLVTKTSIFSFLVEKRMINMI